MPGRPVPTDCNAGPKNLASARVVLIAMEAGSTRPSWIPGHAGGDTIVLARTRDAPPAELTESVAQRTAMALEP